MTTYQIKALILSIIVFLLPSILLADEIRLRDNSLINGQIVSMDKTHLVVETSFAGEIKIKISEITGINSDDLQSVSMESGDKYTARLEYTPAQGQVLVLDDGNVILLGDDKIAGLNTREKTEKDYWSGAAILGIDGQEGNTSELSILTRVELLRETEVNRLSMYGEMNFQRQNEETTTEEYRLGSRFEQDITDRWFAFVSQNLEKDRFENLDLRSTTDTGLGYFFIRKDNLKFKGLTGLGYEFESFTSDDSNRSNMILSAGYDFMYDFRDWLRLGHKFNYYPSITESFSENYRLASNAYTELPLGKDWDWKLRFTLRHDFNNAPVPGVKKLDTAYYLSVVYDWN